MTAGLAVLALLSTAATSSAARSMRPAHIAPDDVEIIACRITWDASTSAPALDRSTGNGCHGIWRVELDDHGRIRVRAINHPVIAVDVTPNGSAAARGQTVGASGGGSSTVLTFHDTRLGRNLDLSEPADAERLGRTSAIWLTLTHDAR